MSKKYTLQDLQNILKIEKRKHLVKNLRRNMKRKKVSLRPSGELRRQRTKKQFKIYMKETQSYENNKIIKTFRECSYSVFRYKYYKMNGVQLTCLSCDTHNKANNNKSDTVNFIMFRPEEGDRKK